MLENFEEIEVKGLADNTFQLLDEDWMLITAGTIDSFNTMTASWGSFGFLWHKPTATIFIRPHRFTLSFVESNDTFTLSFFAEKYRQILNYCGQHSGRNVDKVQETGLVPLQLPSGNIGFEQARLILECKKMYADELRADKFIDKEIIHRIYPSKDFHKMFIGEISHCYIQNEKLKK